MLVGVVENLNSIDYHGTLRIDMHMLNCLALTCDSVVCDIILNLTFWYFS